MDDKLVLEVQIKTEKQRSILSTNVRCFEKGDIPAVSELFVRTFRSGQSVDRAQLEKALYTVYMTSPGDAVRPASLVDVAASGSITGFMGIITLSAKLGERTLQGGILGNFMAEEADRASSAVRLLRTMIKSDVDFIYTDTANQISLEISRALKFKSIPFDCLEWVKVLQPCQTVSAMVGRRSAALGSILRPVMMLGDVAAARLKPFVVPETDRAVGQDRAITSGEFVERTPTFLERFVLKPDWNSQELSWLLERAAEKTRNGGLQLREVLGPNGNVLGYYALYLRAGGVAHVLQVVPKQGREEIIVGAAIRHAAQSGAVAIKGVASAVMADGLIRQSGVFYRHVSSSVIYTNQPDVMSAFQSRESFIGGLLGENWTRLCTDDFD